MCRLILAAGSFDPAAIVDAAVAMASGRTADHDGSFQVHPHGWGAVWRDPSAPRGLAVHRDPRPAYETAAGSPVARATTDFLAMHVRHSTAPERCLPCFTHPVERPDDDWYFMHNGTLPTVHRKIGLPASTFDTAAYFEYLVPHGARRLDRDETLARLAAMPTDGSSGNAIAIRPDRAYVVNWAPDSRAPRYFTMHRLVRPGLEVVASEVVPSLAPADEWQPLGHGTVLEFLLDRERQAS